MATLRTIRERLDRAAVFLDFDGTLAEIVRRPEQARAADGVRDALERLARRAVLVAIVTGRPGATVSAMVAAEGVEVHGLYGLEAQPPNADAARRISELEPLVEAEATLVEGAWVERKGLSLAVHVRESPDPDTAEATLRESLGHLAARNRLQLLLGKRVLEIAAGRPSKGALVERLVHEHDAEAALFAGDDIADLDAFDALDRLGDAGVVAVRVAVQGAETPPELLDRADVRAEGPAGLVALLAELAR